MASSVIVACNTFSRPDQYKKRFSRLAVAVSIASTHHASPTEDGQTELTCVAWYRSIPRTVTAQQCYHPVKPRWM